MLSALVVLAAVSAAWATPPADSNCGVSAYPPYSKIVGGIEAKPNSWPWQIQILYYNQHFCGASLISNDWVLSAAHCFKGFDFNGFKLRAGRHKSSGSNEPYQQDSLPSKILLHDYYNDRSMVNDIALIKLSKPVTFSNQVRPVCLPTKSTLATGTKCYVTGWGYLRDGATTPAPALMQVMVPTIDVKTCNSGSYYNGAIYTGMICAGYSSGGKDACQGDSGGPLVSYINNRWEQYGVVSWGYGCAAPYKPGVYTDIPYFNSWIRQRVTQVEREESEVQDTFQPIPSGAAFREVSKQLVQKGEVKEEDLPNAAAWLHEAQN